MNAEVIAIGDELSSGVRLDTNSRWISQRLGEIGIRVLYHTTVGDDLDANCDVFRLAMNRVPLVFTTGGLGPTADDLTRQALAAATNTELALNEESLTRLKQLFAKRHRKMPDSNLIQAYFPHGSQPIENRHGSAPGIDMAVKLPDDSTCHFFCFPGVPAEMKEMWVDSVEPALLRMIGNTSRCIRHKTIKCFGVGESDLENMLPGIIERGRSPSVGITVSNATISLRVTSIADNADDCFREIEPTLSIIREHLGDLVFGEDEQELQHVIIDALLDQNQTISVAEFGTHGLVSFWLSEVDPDGDTFRGGISVRGAGMPVSGVFKQRGANAFTVDPARGIVELARHVRDIFETDFGIAIGKFREPSPSETESEVQTYLGLVDHELERVSCKPFTGHPAILEARAAKQLLDFLRLHLRERTSKEA